MDFCFQVLRRITFHQVFSTESEPLTSNQLKIILWNVSGFNEIFFFIKLLFRYQAEDEDELSLEVGDTVQVIEYEDPEEQVLQHWRLNCLLDLVTLTVPLFWWISTYWSRRKVGWWASKRRQDVRVSSRPISLGPSEVEQVDKKKKERNKHSHDEEEKQTKKQKLI